MMSEDSSSTAGRTRLETSIASSDSTRKSPSLAIVLRLFFLLSFIVVAQSEERKNSSRNEQVPLSPRTVRLRHGTVRGSLHVTSGVESFLGVPYATPPLGSLRFMPPVTAGHWRGVRLHTKPGNECPQPDPQRTEGGNEDGQRRQISEDCLYLNIWLPYNTSTDDVDSGNAARKEVVTPRLPVLVFVGPEHRQRWSGLGDATSALDGATLAALGQLVVVTLNYRLGLIGFASTASSTGRVHGNFGLFDIIAALHWLHDNIASIGGDPNNVTVAGVGTSGDLTSFLGLTPLATGLFTRMVLLDSGGPASPATMVRSKGSPSREWTLARLARALDCPEPKGEDTQMDCLRAATLEQILRVQSDWSQRDNEDPFFSPLVVDGLSIVGPPQSRSDFGSFPLLFGLSRDHREPDGPAVAPESVLRLVARIVTYYQQVVALAAINEYTSLVAGSDTDDMNAVENEGAESSAPELSWSAESGMLRDALLVAPLNDFAQRLAPTTDGEKKRKRFSFVFSSSSNSRPTNSSQPLSLDAVDVFLPHKPSAASSSPPLLMTRYLINFVRTGDPNGKGVSWWPPFEEGAKKYLRLFRNKAPEVHHAHRAHRLAFWNRLVPQLDRHGQQEAQRFRQQQQQQHSRQVHTSEDIFDDHVLVGNPSFFQQISLKFVNPPLVAEDNDDMSTTTSTPSSTVKGGVDGGPLSTTAIAGKISAFRAPLWLLVSVALGSLNVLVCLAIVAFVLNRRHIRGQKNVRPPAAKQPPIVVDEMEDFQVVAHGLDQHQCVQQPPHHECLCHLSQMSQCLEASSPSQSSCWQHQQTFPVNYADFGGCVGTSVDYGDNATIVDYSDNGGVVCPLLSKNALCHPSASASVVVDCSP